MESSSTIAMKASCSSSSSLFSLPNNPTFHFKSPALKPHNSFSKSLKCIHSLPPDSGTPSRHNSFSCCAVSFSPSQTSPLPPRTIGDLITEFQSMPEPLERVKRLLHYASILAPLPNASRTDSNRVMGCTARVWVETRMGNDGKMRFWVDSDSEITKGYCACLVSLLDGAAPEEVLLLKTEDLAALNVGLAGGERSRVNTWHNVLISMQKRTRALVAQQEGKEPFLPFPSLVVTAEGVQAKGSYAEAQVFP